MTDKTDEKGKQPAQREPKNVYRDYIETILICVIFVIFSRAFIFQQSKIPSGSMIGTLEIGDYIMVNRFVFGPGATALERLLLPQRQVDRGEVVVFKFPRGPETDYIKRVVGLPGDVVQGRSGDVWVNGERLDEPYIYTGGVGGGAGHHLESELFRRRATRDFGPVRVEPDHYFVMGDHRCHSEDSRFWGLVPQANIKGRALLIWYSYPEESTPNGYMSTKHRVGSWRDKILHINRTRWDRCFSLIR